MLEISPRTAFKLGFIISFVLAGAYLGLLILSLGSSGPAEGDTSHLKVSGYAKELDIEQHYPTLTARAAATDAKVDFETESDWDSTGNRTVTRRVIYQGAKGDLMTRDEVTHYGAGDKIQSRVVNILGNYSSEDNFRVTMLPTGEQQLDSEILIDASDGMAKFRLKVVNSSTGRPVTEEELVAYGNLTIDAYRNLSVEEKKEIADGNYLGFCSELDQDNILDESVPDAIYALPPGFELVNGKLVPISLVLAKNAIESRFKQLSTQDAYA